MVGLAASCNRYGQADAKHIWPDPANEFAGYRINVARALMRWSKVFAPAPRSRCASSCGVLIFWPNQGIREPLNAHCWFDGNARSARTQAERRGVPEIQARSARRALPRACGPQAGDPFERRAHRGETRLVFA